MAMARISDHHPQLGEHLDRSIRTGTYCSLTSPTLAPPPGGISGDRGEGHRILDDWSERVVIRRKTTDLPGLTGRGRVSARSNSPGSGCVAAPIKALGTTVMPLGLVSEVAVPGAPRRRVSRRPRGHERARTPKGVGTSSSAHGSDAEGAGNRSRDRQP